MGQSHIVDFFCYEYVLAKIECKVMINAPLGKTHNFFKKVFGPLRGVGGLPSPIRKKYFFVRKMCKTIWFKGGYPILSGSTT